ncbi:FAD-dependent oxidoreductase [Nostocoides japonicum T1-X7]|uniref:FAD-dependent oxidoreductase n=1 Tax=Nostocoides japonicum T1-X7 TaxID=1194083 RepID=A0A077LZT5_9MICO|nr:D-arabinono-1,4-lactone oxidase [Tetrasphaera japonica]CCH79513.1 FAD-dependent oxidoreductase [Tetrasphaera japonica T1-X7]
MSQSWTNWGRNEHAAVDRLHRPERASQVAEIVGTAHKEQRKVKVVGSGHSFTGIAAPAQDQLRLDALTGIVAVDDTRRRVRVRAGTTLRDLNPLLWDLGLAMPNLGDIDAQTIAGAISTGTHGTGAGLQGLAAAVCGLTLVTADGTEVRCSAEEDPGLFQAARVGLGALGVLTEVELQLVPAYRLRAVERPAELMPFLESVQEVADTDRHVEFYWFPHTERVLTKRNTVVDALHPGRPLPRWREELDDHLLSNVVFEGINRLVAWRPSLAPRVNQVSARALSAREFTDRSYRVFCTRRTVRFTESEYAVPRAALVPALLELKAWIEANDEFLPFPVEVRFAAADDIWLSTAYERDTAYLAVHQYHRMDNRRYFAAFEAIARSHSGRPHWGKLHTLGAAELDESYPRFGEFVDVRNRLDPDRVFTNAYLDRVLGP